LACLAPGEGERGEGWGPVVATGLAMGIGVSHGSATGWSARRRELGRIPGQGGWPIYLGLGEVAGTGSWVVPSCSYGTAGWGGRRRGYLSRRSGQAGWKSESWARREKGTRRVRLRACSRSELPGSEPAAREAVSLTPRAGAGGGGGKAGMGVRGPPQGVWPGTGWAGPNGAGRAAQRLPWGARLAGRGRAPGGRAGPGARRAVGPWGSPRQANPPVRRTGEGVTTGGVREVARR
jgi:hypothetical protein